jgi:predicted lipoprotein with Yx(FWY)xxD motif
VIALAARALVNLGRVAIPAAAAALLIAGCASSKSSTPAGGGGSSATAIVETHSGPAGTFLTDGSGKTLYMFASDTATTSTCTGTCVTYWPPLTTTGAPSASGSAASTMLATITRSDGSKQVTYDGHPLYYFKQDSAAGDTKGQGNSNFGAKWWLLAPSGQPITGGSSAPGSSAPGSSAPSSSASSSSSGGGGGWS